MYSLSRMVDGDRYGIDIVRQISAVRDGLERVRDELRRETRGAVSLLPS
jgi:DNA-binding FrmR family transcriptional regulator